MKKGIKKALIAVVICFAMHSYAKGFSHVETANETELIHMDLGKIRKGSKVVIKDYHGLVIYKKAIKESGVYDKYFDLTSLPEGDYYFELDKQFEIKIIPFKVMPGSVSFNKKEETTIIKPSIIIKGDQVHISKISLKKKPIEVMIYKNYDLIYSEESKDAQQLNRVYDFSTAARGDYEIIIKSEGRKFTENVKI